MGAQPAAVPVRSGYGTASCCLALRGCCCSMLAACPPASSAPALWNLAYRNNANRKAFVLAGAIPPLVRLLAVRGAIATSSFWSGLIGPCGMGGTLPVANMFVLTRMH